MIRGLSKSERERYQAWALDNVGSDVRVFRSGVAVTYLAYEATLEAKDAQIERLVAALRDADEALRHHPGGDNRLPVNIDKATSAIKEAIP